MKWKNEEYGYLKNEIYELTRMNLAEIHAKKLSLAELFKAIDEFVEACKNGQEKRIKWKRQKDLTFTGKNIYKTQ